MYNYKEARKTDQKEISADWKSGLVCVEGKKVTNVASHGRYGQDVRRSCIFD